MPKKIISLIVPVFNEDPSVVYAFVNEIENLIASLSHFDFELIFIDDSQIESCRQLTKLLAKEKKFINSNTFFFKMGKEHSFELDDYLDLKILKVLKNDF
jgi:membrane glycosyltransferase